MTNLSYSQNGYKNIGHTYKCEGVENLMLGKINYTKLQYLSKLFTNIEAVLVYICIYFVLIISWKLMKDFLHGNTATLSSAAKR